MTLTPRYACLAAALLACPANLLADVTIVERVAVHIGGQSTEGVRTTYIKGQRMRIEQVAGGSTSATLFDLAAGTIAVLDPKARRADMTGMPARAAEVEREYPRARATAAVTASGATKIVAGQTCAEYTFTVGVPMVKDPEPAMQITGTAWIAAAAPGAGDYLSFAKAANDRSLIIGYLSSNRILLAHARGQTELYRALTAVPGIPCAIDMTIAFQGHGVLTKLLNKTSGSRTSTLTSVSVEPIADTMFSVPADWSKRNK